MEAFRLLSRGGAKFDKGRFRNDVKLFSTENAESKNNMKSSTQDLAPGQLPPELDFFKYAKAAPSGPTSEPAAPIKPTKAKEEAEPTQGKKRKRGNEERKESLLKHRVTSSGDNVAPPITEFEDLSPRYKVPQRLLQNIENCGYDYPTGIQAHGIPVLLEGRHLIAISPTGTGKTMSYLLPIFSLLQSPLSSKSPPENAGKGVRAVIVSPTRELAAQIYNECLKLAEGRKWRIILYGKATGSTLAQPEVRDKVDIVVTTPLRLVDSLQKSMISLDNVRCLVLDEADRLLEGEFFSQTEEIVQSCTHPNLQKAVFSATLPAGAEAIANNYLDSPKLTFVGTESGKLLTLRQQLAGGFQPPVLIFVQSQERAQELSEELLYDGRNVDVLHSGRTRKQRTDAAERFQRGECHILVATEVMARGMDFAGVRLVINYDFPQSVQSYIHRIGRTGRAGREGEAVTYFTNADAPYLKMIANVLKASNNPVPEWMLKLSKPSKMKRRALKRKPVVRKDVGVVAGRAIGKGDAIRRKDMIAASKRRKMAGDKSGLAEEKPDDAENL
ncbi:ATP-dependent RNA helicase ROK1 [Debaryomyces hansenii CBS767] [Rhizoctonia solani]|uniref:RNA helicase n=1 Tax=Rhizoctonia solani TaxID=456999 RepID=A0A0K6G2L1_9AGAM|nr:ATP-dependent RNA helicase ROK1 [Debaryomyces hansenii CBS767] [Rhizoctonia solani]